MKSLGDYLRNIRTIQQKTLRMVEESTGISNSYLCQLERGQIRRPSPIVLHKLSIHYEIDYEELMNLAGYPINNPKPEKNVKSISKGKRFRVSKRSIFDDLTPGEEEALTEYLAFLRSTKRKKGDIQRKEGN